ncbi:glycosyl hydrolase family 61-domain-containing protein, partial [Cristinia sonorae]
MKSFTTLVVSVLAALPYVAAHGFVSQVKIDGKSYKGRTPGSNNADSVIRTISSQNPIKGAHNPAVNCGTNAKRANLIADANPGSRLEFFWNGADMSHWPHNIGPIISYLAECDGPCNQYDSTRAKWFKIDQKGKKSNSNTWVQQDLFDSKPVSVTLPDNLKAGNYLLRHEIIALHLATDQGGAEFYASCTQLRVGGNGRGVPSPNELVSIPGAYNDNDAGIYVPGVFGNGNYKMPGPAIAKLVQGAPGNNGDNDDDNNNGGNN